jgi:AraC family transcriptional regulator, regulatory protein of adaptative response / methylated-DNA-[protein]-cysteine methyltransferase
VGRVSPKRCQQFLSLEQARARLREGETVLAATWSTGLSRPDRLHDLLVTASAVTPGKLRRRGEDLEIRWSAVPSPFGTAVLGLTDRGPVRAPLRDPRGRHGGDPAQRAARRAAGRFRIHPADRRARVRRNQTARRPAAVRLQLRGTNFQLKVWEALLSIPEGRILSYGDLARLLAHPDATRAVGGANPVSLVIPCHRVLRADGRLGGYRRGEDRKLGMLALEAARTDDDVPVGSRT